MYNNGCHFIVFVRTELIIIFYTWLYLFIHFLYLFIFLIFVYICLKLWLQILYSWTIVHEHRVTSFITFCIFSVPFFTMLLVAMETQFFQKLFIIRAECSVMAYSSVKLFSTKSTSPFWIHLVQFPNLKKWIKNWDLKVCIEFVPFLPSVQTLPTFIQLVMHKNTTFELCNVV